LRTDFAGQSSSRKAPFITITWSTTASFNFPCKNKVVPWGPQTVFSRAVRVGATGKGGTKNPTYEIVQKQVGGAKLVDDDGFDASVAFSPTQFMDLTLAFDHSMHYEFNTLSFSVGFNMSQIFSRKPF
jgi:hypothetical protein